MSRAFKDFKQWLFAAVGCFSLFLLLVRAQGQSQLGFTSIDCGRTEVSSYNETNTGLTFLPDKDYIDTGESKPVAIEYVGSLKDPWVSLRYFPNVSGIRNCYRLNLTVNTKYLIRASFYYGNYDGLSKTPEFELHLGTNLWKTVTFQDASELVYHELIHISFRDYIHICLVNIGFGDPFISMIEIRQFPSDAFDRELVNGLSLARVVRYDTGDIKPGDQCRYPDDKLDRIWDPDRDHDLPSWTELTTNLSDISSLNPTYEIPFGVLNTAGSPAIETDSFVNIWTPSDSNDDTSLYFIYLHFAEVEILQPNQTRMFTITMDGSNFALWPSPAYGSSDIISSVKSLKRNEINISIIRTEDSTLPPILNAFEVYTIIDMTRPETDIRDFDSISNMKKTYGIGKNWQGDPCAPQKYAWEGLSCTYPENNMPSRITSLDLSWSGLIGYIAPGFSELEMLQTLNLSNNNLIGSIPGFLSQLQNLRIIDLSNNNLTDSIPVSLSLLPNLTVLYLDGNFLTGSVPTGLILKHNGSNLSLRVCNNPNLSGVLPCDENNNSTNKKKSKPNLVLLVGLPIIGAASIISLTLAIVFCFCKKRSKKNVVVLGAAVGAQPPRNMPVNVELEKSRRQFTYLDILKITNNKQRKIGHGGFGTVYHGYINENTEVAVKMLSLSSTQGLDQFHAEVNSLMRVHHTNLASLIGYCDDEDHKGLVYEFMPRGNLQQMLSDSSAKVLAWEDRLQIATDAALGLEYLHYGCKPPIMHRDIKTTNILLSENFRAKISDLGLSINFLTGDGTHIVTGVAGTPGYIAPEYRELNRYNEKSDVYSFGIVLLEIITGQLAVSRTRGRISIDEWVGSMMPTGDISNIVDSRLNGVFNVSSAWKIVEIATACVSQEAYKRPSMSKVVRELKQCLQIQLSQGNESTYQTEPRNDFDTPENGYSITMRPSAR